MNSRGSVGSVRAKFSRHVKKRRRVLKTSCVTKPAITRIYTMRPCLRSVRSKGRRGNRMETRQRPLRPYTSNTCRVFHTLELACNLRRHCRIFPALIFKCRHIVTSCKLSNTGVPSTGILRYISKYANNFVYDAAGCQSKRLAEMFPTWYINDTLHILIKHFFIFTSFHAIPRTLLSCIYWHDCLFHVKAEFMWNQIYTSTRLT